MANELCTSLGLSDRDVSGKLVQIKEEESSSGSFVVASVMWEMNRRGTSLVLVTLHQSAGHYQSICKKLGFNLQSDSIIDPFHLHIGRDKPFANVDMSEENNLSTLYTDVSHAVNALSGKKCLIVDDLSALLSLGASVQTTVAFLHYLLTLLKEDKDLSLVICNHSSGDSEDLQTLSNWISHQADVRIQVAGLKTGFSANVDGSIEIVDNMKDAYTVEKKFFHFKLADRQIKVFAPGSVGIKT